MEKTDRARNFDNALSAGAAISSDLYYSLMADYPYFLPATILRMQDDTLTADQRNKLRSSAATTICNRADLYYLVGKGGNELRKFNKTTTPKTKSTMDTITHFLDTFGNNDANELRALEQRIFNPTPDYSQLLAQEEEKSGTPAPEGEQSEQDKLIDKFISESQQPGSRFTPTDTPEQTSTAEPKKEKPSAPKAQKSTAVSESDPSSLSESLAKIYIRQHKFEKALEIIQSLSLNYSEKSIYFADQMRFLRKLIENEKYKQNKQ